MTHALSPTLLDAAVEIQEFCERRRWRFCFIGGLAVQHWGEQRFTRDADLTVFAGIGRESEFVEELLARFASRAPNPREFAQRTRVLALSASNGMPIDVSLGAVPFEQASVEQASLQEIAPGLWLRLCSPAALAVYKIFAGRPRDWIDVEGIVIRSGRRIDWSEVRGDLRELLALKQDEEALPRLEKLLASYGY